MGADVISVPEACRLLRVHRNTLYRLIRDEQSFPKECRLFRARNSRHTFGTHAALFGVNPWRLMTWLGHKRIDETMRYVHLADSHRRDLPPEVLAAAEGEFDPDRRILKLLAGRANPRQPDGNTNKAHENLVGFKVVSGGVDGT